VLKQAPTEPLDLTLPIATHGADLVGDPATGSVAVETKSGDTLVAAPQPLMWDSSADAGGQPDVAKVDTTIGETTAGTPTLTLSPDEGFLSNPDTVYPVTIDPSYSNSVNTTGDTWAQNADYTTSQASSGELRAGTYDSGGHKARSFMHFDTTKWNGKHILSANLVLRNWYSGSCTGAAIRASRISEAWTAGNVTWGNQPAVGGSYYDDYTPAKGYTSSCAGGDATWSIKDMVQDWATGGYANNGIRLKAVDEASIYTWRKYRSANYGGSVVPHIDYTYNSYPIKPGAVSVITTPASSAGYSVSTTPAFRTTVSDPDGGSVRALFEVYNGATKVWSGYSAYVSSGSTATLTMNSGLANGTIYTVKALANDGTDNSAYTGSTTFTVDTTKPSVGVTASAFINGQWTTTVPASNTLTFTGSSDTKSFAWTVDGIAQTAKTADATGKAAFSWLPASGSHTVTATPTDKAGNVGSASTFTFGVGPASFASPHSSARSTGVFPIQSSGPPNATSATLSWRYAGQSSWTALTGVTTTNGVGWTPSNITTQSGSSATPALLWDATGQEDPASTTDPKAHIAAPALIELRTCFNYAGTPAQVCSDPRQVQLVPSAFSGNFPVTQVGPATVALFTGEASFAEGDAVDSAAGVGRTFASFDEATTKPGAFGPGWSTSLISAGDTAADLVDNRTKDKSFVLVTAGNASQTFVTVDPGANPVNPGAGVGVTFRPAGVDDGSRLVLKDDTVTLTRPQSTVTTWTKQTDGSWLVQTAATSGATSNDPEATFESLEVGYPTWIAETQPGVAAACTLQEQAPGCRGLKLSYTGNGPDQRVSKIERLTAGAAPLTLATYSYNGQGQLTGVCGPDPDGPGQLVSVCSAYDYDTSMPGRTLLKTITPPGQAAWRFSYDAEGRLDTVKRALDPNTNQGSGDATWTVAYDLAPGASGLPDMSATAAAAWGQTVVPTRTFAVFTPTRVPSSAPSAADLAYAQVFYTDANGTTTNTAVQGAGGWLVDTSWYDDHGNVYRTLDGAGRNRALAAASAIQAQVASDASAFTRFNDAGTRVEDEYGPVQNASLKDGTSGPFRSHTAYTHDDEAPNLGGGSKPDYDTANGQTSFDLVVEIRHSAADPDLTGEHEATVVRNEYDPGVTGDGNGWTLGTPTRVETQLADGSWSTQVIRRDTEGRVIETRQPGGQSAADGSGNDAHATVTTYYRQDPSAGQCDSTGHKAWTGLTCTVGPAGQPSGPTMPTTRYANYDEDLRPTSVQETSGTSTRTTTTGYDVLGRPTTSNVTLASDTVASTTGYDPDTGLPSSVARGTDTVTTSYDTWGRVRDYHDALGGVSTTTYTSDSQIATFADGAGGLYEYTYDGASGEHRRVPTSVKTGFGSGIPDTFTLDYDATGAQTKVTYPNGMVASYGHDQIGVPTSLDYTAPGVTDPLLSFTAIADVDGRVLANTSTGSEQAYSYDALGRLTQVHDTRDDANGDPAAAPASTGSPPHRNGPASRPTQPPETAPVRPRPRRRAGPGPTTLPTASATPATVTTTSAAP
jgi:YD repeat-containing protein